MKSKIIKRIAIPVGIIFSAVLLACVAYSLVWNGVIILNGFSARKYPVKGVDVSSYQGKIHWEELSDENISFAFIKG